MITVDSALSDLHDLNVNYNPALALDILGFAIEEDARISDALIQATAATDKSSAVDLVHSVVATVCSAVKVLMQIATFLVHTVFRHPYVAMAVAGVTAVYGIYKFATDDDNDPPSDRNINRDLYNMNYFKSKPSTVSNPVASYRSQNLSSAIQKSTVIDAIVQGANIVGMDQSTMLAIAKAESAYGTITSQSSSSAQGIFQIVQGTWRQHYPEFNKKYGIPVNSPNDPLSASIFASAYVKDVLSPKIKAVTGNVTVADIYATYVFGPKGGIDLLKEYVKNPDAPTVYTYGTRSYAKAQIRANPTFFYNKDYSLKTVRDTYNLIASKVTFTPEEQYTLQSQIQPKQQDTQVAEVEQQQSNELTGDNQNINLVRINNKIYGVSD